MAEVNSLSGPAGNPLAYVHSAGEAPSIVFLGGFRSDMTGTKAVHLEAWAQVAGLAFLRLDYSGHGASGGRFEDGSIGQWADDAEAVMSHVITGPVVLVGSSMGGWIALLLARKLGAQVKGLVTIAAAPDFTETIRANLTPMQSAGMKARGRILVPSPHGDPYVITRRMLDEGRNHLLLESGLALAMPVRLLHGSADAEVPLATAFATVEKVTSPDLRLTVVQGADHRFSSPECLDLITKTIAEVIGLAT